MIDMKGHKKIFLIAQWSGLHKTSYNLVCDTREQAKDWCDNRFDTYIELDNYVPDDSISTYYYDGDK